MEAQKNNLFLILTQSCFFGWLLSFPFFGPLLEGNAPDYNLLNLSLPGIFTLFHALAFLAGGLFLKRGSLWKKLMLGSLIVILATHLALLLSDSSLWPWGMAIMGVSSAVYILGWSYPYSMFVTITGRMKIMALTIIIANIIYVLFNLLSHTYLSDFGLTAGLLPLGAALAILLSFPDHAESKIKLPLPPAKIASFSFPLLLIFCLFVGGLYLCSGFMYTIILPALGIDYSPFIYYRYFFYIAILVIMFYGGEKLQRFFPVYIGVTLLGFAFVSFALLFRSTAGLLLTQGLIEAAYAFLDLFVWTVLGDLAFTYGAPFQFFGFAVGIMLFSILAGELISTQLLQIGAEHRLITAVFAAASIFLTFSVIPWLNERMHKDFYKKLKKPERGIKKSREEDIYEENRLIKVMDLLNSEQDLTPREVEITALLLRGLTNKAMAAKLYISENTLKTHLKHIYRKFGVTQKRELLALMLTNDTSRKNNH